MTHPYYNVESALRLYHLSHGPGTSNYTRDTKGIGKRPYMFKYYYDAVKFWLELTRGGGRMDAVEPSDEIPATTT